MKASGLMHKELPTSCGLLPPWAISLQSLTEAVGDHFAMLIKHPEESKRPNARGAAQFMWAVATLGHEPANEGFADAVCEHFAIFIKHLDAPKHAPPDGVASAILERLTTL